MNKMRKFIDKYWLLVWCSSAILMTIFGGLLLYVNGLSNSKINEFNQVESQIKYVETLIEGIQSANERSKNKLKTSKELNFNGNKTLYFSQFGEKNVKESENIIK